MLVTEDVDLAEWDGVLIPERVRNRGSLVLSLNDALREYKPIRPGVYVRISLDRFGLEKGVTRQLEDAEQKRVALGWGPFAKVYKENDTGAYKKRKITHADDTVEWMVIRPEGYRLAPAAHADSLLLDRGPPAGDAVAGADCVPDAPDAVRAAVAGTVVPGRAITARVTASARKDRPAAVQNEPTSHRSVAEQPWTTPHRAP
jgi:hypothetical protein